MQIVGEYAVLLSSESAVAAAALYRDIGARLGATVADAVPGARTILVTFRDFPTEEDLRSLERLERDAIDTRALADGAAREIKVRYDGPDLEVVARAAGLTQDEVVDLHQSAEYRVAFVGFQPGFAYVAGLPDALHVPRRASPRAKIPAGSVAIAEEWTGVYPAESPGGWHLIGTTEQTLFDPERDPPALLGPGDRVRFVPR